MELKIIDELLGGMPSWTEEANCKGADADLFSLKEGLLLEKQKQFAEHVQFKTNALSTQ